jgi:hypothetical protein
MKRCKFVLNYGEHVARFSHEGHARDFGKSMSRFGLLVEMRDKTGLIGQWHNGGVTPEFAHTEA